MPAHPSGANRKGRASKASILAAAADVFSQRGFRGATMADIAAAAGLTHPGLLYHFPRKEDLLFAVMDEHLVPGVSRISAAAEDGSRAVLSALVAIARENAADPAWTRLASALVAESLAPDHPAHAYMRARAASIADALASGLGDLETDPARRLAIARVLNGAWDGLRMHGALDDSFDPVADLEILVELVVRDSEARGLRASP